MKIVKLFLFAVLFLAFATPTLAQNKDVVVSTDEVVNQDYFAFGENILIDGVINGDLYAAGNLIEINGQVNGDVLAAGSSIFINGVVTEDARLAGKNLRIRNTIGGNMTLGGADIRVENTATVGGSIVAGGELIEIATFIPKNVIAMAQTLVITAPIGGDVRARVENLTLTETASVGGDLVYSSPKDPEISPQATISGQVVEEPLPPTFRRDDQQIKQEAAKILRGVSVVFSIANGLSLLVIGLLLLAFYPIALEKPAHMLQTRFPLSLLVSFLILFLVPMMLTFILFTLVGIPLALLGFVLWGVTIYLAPLPVSMWLGALISRIFKTTTSPSVQFIIGLVGLTLLGLVPYIGWVVKLVIVLAGLGALYLSLFKSGREKQKLEP